MAIRCIDLASLWMQGRDANCNIRYPVGSNADRGEVGACGIFEPDSCYTVWNAAGLSEAEYVVSPPKEKAGPQARASGKPSPTAGTDRQPYRAPCRNLPEMRRAIVPLPGNSDTLCRRYSSHPTGGYRTCD